MSRPVRQWRSASREAYEAFCKKYPHYKIKYRLYQAIIRTYNDLFAKHVLETGDRLKMPYGVGPLCVTKYKPARTKIDKATGKEVPNLAVDYKKSKEEGKLIYHLNFHTEGYKYYWAWFPRESFIKYAPIWSFRVARVHSRILAVYLKQKDPKYRNLYRQWVKPNH